MWFQVRLSLCGNEHLSTLYFKGASSKHRKTPRRENVSAFFVCRKKGWQENGVFFEFNYNNNKIIQMKHPTGFKSIEIKFNQNIM